MPRRFETQTPLKRFTSVPEIVLRERMPYNGSGIDVHIRVQTEVPQMRGYLRHAWMEQGMAERPSWRVYTIDCGCVVGADHLIAVGVTALDGIVALVEHLGWASEAARAAVAAFVLTHDEPIDVACGYCDGRGMVLGYENDVRDCSACSGYGRVPFGVYA